jgi:uncharacterized membrane protein
MAAVATTAVPAVARNTAAAPPVRTPVVTRGLSQSGVCLAALLVSISLTPSLLPRTWLVQGVISGISACAGYAIGAGVGWMAAVWLKVRPGAVTRRRAWVALAASGGCLLAVSTVQGSRWQRDLHRLMGEPAPSRWSYLAVLILTTLLLAVLIALVRVVRATARLLAGPLSRWMPSGAARITACCAVVLLLLALANRIVLDAAGSAAATLNRVGTAATAPPTGTYRSGGPASVVSWSSLGLQGRAFVSGGPTVTQLRAFNGTQPREPVRVYVGLDAAPTLAARAALAVRELKRTDAFSRKVLVVVTATGTGWINPHAAAALEYLYNGDTALVAIQYSKLPSWLSFLTERSSVEDAGRVLFNQVYDEWGTRPAASRPKLLAFGESLGSLGSEAAFRDISDIRARTDGALWVGPTNANPLWSGFVDRRDRDSTEVRPVFQGGATVRFATGIPDLSTPPPGALRPRVVYLQHGSDPIVWWSPALLIHRPDWLREHRAPDVLPAMRWYPFVTFWQVTGDLAYAAYARPGHGHNYRAETVAAWATMIAPPGWSDADTARLIVEVNAPRLRPSPGSRADVPIGGAR